MHGGLEVPYRLKFSAISKEISKIIKLLSLAPPSAGSTATIAKPTIVNKSGPVSSNSACSPMSVKRDPDESCDLTMEPHLQLKDAGQETVPQPMQFGLSWRRLR